jgi:hypothetical protein
MPHHWKPIDPSSPNEDEKVGRLALRLGKRLNFVGRAEDGRVWALLHVGNDELNRLADEVLVTLEDPCAQTFED